MTSFTYDEKAFSKLQDKVVVLTGGANGIGSVAVQMFISHGANVVFGDIDSAGGAALAASLSKSSCHFQRTDVTSYESILALFDKALELYGRVDVAVSNAGIVERPGWFEPTIDLESVRKAPSTAVLDINLTGSLYFSRIAVVYLRHNATVQDENDKNLVLLSSVAGFEPSPGLFVYQPSKHGVLGIMRALHEFFQQGDTKIRINCVCPWATDTVMVKTFIEGWKREGLPLNTPDDVARIILGVAVDDKLTGESIYVEGGRGWAIEEGLKRTKPQWLGESAAASLDKGQAFLGSGNAWT